MKRVELKHGDNAWIYITNHNGKLTKGKVVHIFGMYNEKQYVIEIDTGIDPILLVRDGFTVSDKKKLPIGMWRQN